ncbi:SAM-dependent DNA methyltransferase [Pyruvatibacter sp.]
MTVVHTPKGAGAVMESRGRSRKTVDKSRLKGGNTPAHERRTADADLDYFPTPPWGTRALCEWMIAQGLVLADKRVLEPAAGGGWMARVLEEYFASVVASDVKDYGCGYPVRDFLMGDHWVNHGCGGGVDSRPADWVISNPPFILGLEFILKAIALNPSAGIAMLARLSFAEGGKRHRELFAPHPPSHIVQFVDRVAMVKNRVDRKASTATPYAWFIWMPPYTGRNQTEFCWLPPGTRAACERDSDYRESAGSPAAETVTPHGVRGPEVGQGVLL